MTNTPNYQLPLYAESDAPDLITGYNAAVTKLAKLKVNANGFVYYKE